MKILVAEDEAVSRELLTSLLTKWGYKVVSVADGNEAWRMFQEQDDLRIAILDWMMPGKDGVSLCRLIRDKLKDGGYIYTIILTARDDKEDALAGLAAGADDYITKPFNSEELRIRLQIGKRILDLERTLQDAYLEMKRLATFDALTGLWNRRVVLEQLEKEWDRSTREGKALSIVLADIDHFKHFNDHYGHALGDRVLIHLSHLLRDAVRPYDGIGRYGGEEFLLFLPECDEQRGYQIAERLRKELESRPFKEEETPLKITASFGGTTFLANRCRCNVTHLLKVADDALYEAKNAGRNRVVWLPSTEDNGADR
ncbi:MAG TPA: diguanylate cyclase response regulator [Syntrophobacteraceae bacterium]|nr:diguanylate cyclase response regulator [Syntrophobacteraceae bacterium]